MRYVFVGRFTVQDERHRYIQHGLYRFESEKKECENGRLVVTAVILSWKKSFYCKNRIYPQVNKIITCFSLFKQKKNFPHFTKKMHFKKITSIMLDECEKMHTSS